MNQLIANSHGALGPADEAPPATSTAAVAAADSPWANRSGHFGSVAGPIGSWSLKAPPAPQRANSGGTPSRRQRASSTDSSPLGSSAGRLIGSRPSFTAR